jgi:hypothetical protein
VTRHSVPVGAARGSAHRLIPLLAALVPLLVHPLVHPGVAGLEAAPPSGSLGVIHPALQVPPEPDTLRPPGDTLPHVAPEADTLDFATDTVLTDAARQVPPRNLPLVPGGTPGRPEAGIWVWDREGLLGTEALTLHDLLTQVPGLIPLRGGDIGTPVAVTTAGLGPGQIRLFRDGIEDPPQEGGVVDLNQVGLAGLEEVRVERRPAELRIHLNTLRLVDPRPYTLLDVGTGDQRTNLFRATFAHPSVLGGTLLVAMDRLDTEGDGSGNQGAAFGTRLRYTAFQGERGGIAVDYRSRTARRPEGVFSPQEVDRKDWTVQGSWELWDGVVGGLHFTTGRVEPGSRASPAADTLLPVGSRREFGGRLGTEIGPGWVRAGAGTRWGQGWSSSIMEVEAGGALEGVGGISGTWEREGWREGDAGRSLSVRAWTEPRFGVSLFAEAQDLRRGIPWVVPRPLPPGEEEDGNGDPTPPPEPGNGDDEPDDLPGLRFTERSGFRAGARAEFGGLDLMAAFLVAEGDSLAPMGLPFDRDGFTTPAGRRTGVELAGRLPLDRIRDGLHLRGHAHFWDAGSWRYLPERSWLGAAGWRHQGYDSNLEIWTDVGVRGRDAMWTPLVAEGAEGFFQAPSALSWFARLQIRVVTVRAFVHWENFTVRDDNLEFPGRPQPRTRAVYGIRWTMWN